jgi:hypothetical protein
MVLRSERGAARRSDADLTACESMIRFGAKCVAPDAAVHLT